MCYNHCYRAKNWIPNPWKFYLRNLDAAQKINQCETRNGTKSSIFIIFGVAVRCLLVVWFVRGGNLPRGQAVWVRGRRQGRPRSPLECEIWHFPIKCFAKKVFLVSSGQN